ncbi:MAG: AAA family ATPase [Hyphomonadaceae bacterium]|nr:AAA family ATPase [Hyphomonadaceae bacterium]
MGRFEMNAADAPRPGPSTFDEPAPPPFGLRDLWSAVRRRAGVGFAAFVVLAAAAAAYFLMQPPRYTATALVLINPQAERVLSADQALVEGSPTSAVVDSELEVMRSPALAQRLVQHLKLAEDPRWNPALRPPSLRERVLGPIREALGQSQRTAVGPPTEAETTQLIAERVKRSVNVRRRALSFVLEVTASTGSAQESARIANALADLYLRSGVEARAERGEQATGWLAQRVEELRLDTKAKEDAVEAYRAEAGIFTEDGRSQSDLQLGETQAAVLAARADLAEKEARYRQVQQLIDQGGSADTIANAINSNVIRDLRQQEAQLTRRQADLENRYGELHPAVQNGRAELADLRGQISAELSRIRVSLRNDLEIARTRLRTMESSLVETRGDAASTSAALVRLRELEREASAARSVYESFLERLHEVDDQGRLDAIQARIVSRAQAPRAPSEPKLSIALLLAFGVGRAGAVLAILIAETLDDAIGDADAVERRLGMPVIVSIPFVKKNALRMLPPGERHPAGLIIEKPMSAFAEAFRVLRTSVLYSDLDRRTQIVAITSALPEEGKTTTALCLARIAAMSGQRTIIVDCDLRRQSLNELLDISPAQGLLQVLMGKADWRNVTGQDEASGVHVLPTASGGFTPRDIFGAEAMTWLLGELRAAYDLIILDCPPVLAVAETRVLSTRADAVVMVGRWGVTPMRALAAAIEQLPKSSARLLGIALNSIDPRVPGRSSYTDALYYKPAQRYYHNA